MSQGFYGFPNILDIVRATTFKAIGKTGATRGAALAGGTASGAPVAPAGPFDVGDLIVDASGSLWICTTAGTSQSSPGTFVQVGTLVDPLTTRGDVIVRGASATTRLALGTTNYVLTSNGTDAVWALTPAAAGGALTQLAQTTLLSTTASVTFSSISGAYSALVLHVQGRGDASALNVGVRMQMNNDTSLGYDHLNIADNNGAAAGGTGVAGDSSIFLGNIPAATASASNAGAVECTFPNYAGTTFNKCCLSQNLLDQSQTLATLFAYAGGGLWRGTAAISTIKIFPSSGSFLTGSTFTLYGMS